MPDEREKIELLEKVFDNQQTLISSADSKANIALTIQTFMTTSVLGATVIVDTLGKVAKCSSMVMWPYYLLFALFIITSIIGLILCILVFRPSPPQEEKELKRDGLTYFDHIIKFKTSDDYQKKINKITQPDIVNEFACQNYTLALLLHSKMKYVKSSTVFLIINIGLGIILLGFSLAIK